MTSPHTEDSHALTQLAETHGLELDRSSITVNEMGLDFRVAIARTVTGEPWVLRMPRRDDVNQRAEVESRVLRFVAPHRTAKVPNWRIHTPELIAYPLLPGDPGLELDDQGEPVWQVDVSTSSYAESFGDVLAELHKIDTSQAHATGIDVRSPTEVREGWRSDIAKVQAHFDVADHLLARWCAWVDDGSYWPDRSVLTHGEMYAAHTLVIDDHITAILDWTSAAVGDPASDFMIYHATASPNAFDTAVRRYVDQGGQILPRLAEHCAEMFSANPVSYGLYALSTGDDAHLDAAAAQLNPRESN